MRPNLWIATLAVLVFTSIASAAPAKVEVVRVGDGYRLHVNDEPFFIKGVGGDGDRKLLRDIGANAFRTWGADNIKPQLDQAHALGLKVVVGIWLRHERHGFDYNDLTMVADQFEYARKIIDTYKDHPAVLAWGIGNEMEGFAAGDDAAIWSAVQSIAAYAKKVDPNHPTMTITAEVGGRRVEAVHRLCPDIDIMGINSYAGLPSLPERYRAAGGTKPYVITEFGPPGTWEVEKTDYGAVPEPTSTQKAESYRNSYEKGILAEKDKLCLGSFAFVWGNKQEATATWFGMLLPDGSRTGAVDVMQELWTGMPPADRVPVIEPIVLETDRPAPGQTIRATVRARDPEGKPLAAEWMMTEEVAQYGVGGDAEAAPATVEGAIVQSDASGAVVKMPDHANRYRLYVTVRDPNGGAATANALIYIPGDAGASERPLAPRAKLPLVLYGEGQQGLPFVWSGWMGDTAALAMDAASTERPHAGATAMRCSFNKTEGFGGIVWQSPDNDWGDRPGGFDLSGAKRLVFHARGERGGEQVEFKFGVIEKAKPFHDTASRGTVVTLGRDWQQYSIPLDGLDLRRIKTGFAWVVQAQSAPVTFYLDEVRYE